MTGGLPSLDGLRPNPDWTKYKLHTDQELFDKAYGYIRQYY